MGWRLELVQSESDAAIERIAVCDIGEIVAPGGIDDVVLGLGPSQRILRAFQQAVVGLQEQCLKSKALHFREADTTLVLKDYRSRSVQTLFGPLIIRVPRLIRHGSRLPTPCFFQSSARSASEYDQIRSRLGAFMSFRAAERFIGDLFPFAVGCSVGTTRRRVLRRAAQIKAEAEAAKADCSAPQGSLAAGAIDLGIDTTFVRSSAATGPRHHEVLIGVGTNEQGSRVKIGAVISMTDRPHKLIQRTLHDLGQGDATHITTFTDGDKMLRGYLKKAGLAAPPLLDWAHLARRVQIAKTTAKGLRCATNETGDRQNTRKLHWKLWHGNVDGARDAVKRIAKLLRPFDIGITRARTAIPAKRLQTAMGKLGDYIEGQSAHLVNYGLRHRQGQLIGTSTTEGLANTLVNQRMNKLQQMRWSAAGAHAVIVVRARFLNAANCSSPTQGKAA